MYGCYQDTELIEKEGMQHINKKSIDLNPLFLSKILIFDILDLDTDYYKFKHLIPLLVADKRYRDESVDMKIPLPGFRAYEERMEFQKRSFQSLDKFRVNAC